MGAFEIQISQNKIGLWRDYFDEEQVRRRFLGSVFQSLTGLFARQVKQELKANM
jgi:hypothetical protein